MATKPKSALPSFYGERRPDGSIIERTPEGLSNPAAATQQSPSHSQRSITISSAQQRGHDELASVRTKDHSTSDDPAHGEGVRYRHWAPHKPAILSSTVRADRNQGYNQSIGVATLERNGRPRQRPTAVSTDESSDATSEDERERERERRHHRLRHRRAEKQRRLEELRSQRPLNIPWKSWMASETKNHFVAVVGEFIGTFLFLFFAFAGTGVANIGVGTTTNNTTTEGNIAFNPTVQLYIALSFGFSLMVNAWIFFRISGGLFNPAVTLALLLVDAIHWGRAIFLFCAQIGGACFAAYIVKVLFPTPFNVQVTLSRETTIAQGIFIEAICTAELVFTIIMLAKEKHKATFIAPVGIGLALFIGELVAVYYTGGALNPARALGPSAVTYDFTSDAWIYWVAALIGTLLAVGFYKLIKLLEYEMANPGQDGDVHNDPTQNPEHELAQVVQEREAEVQEIKEIQEELAQDADKAEEVTEAQSVIAAEQAGVADRQAEVVEEQAEVEQKQEEVMDRQASVTERHKHVNDDLDHVLALQQRVLEEQDRIGRQQRETAALQEELMEELKHKR